MEAFTGKSKKKERKEYVTRPKDPESGKGKYVTRRTPEGNTMTYDKSTGAVKNVVNEPLDVTATSRKAEKKPKEKKPEQPKQQAIEPEMDPELIEQAVGTMRVAAETGMGYEEGANQAKRDSNSLWESGKDLLSNPDFWVGAAPLLTGFLTGYTTEGYKHAGIGWTKRYNDREKQAAEERAAARKTASTSPKMKAVYDEKTGKSYYMPEDKVAGLQVGSSSKDLGHLYAKKEAEFRDYIRRGGHISVGKDAYGEQAFINKITRSADPFQKVSGRLTAPQRRSIEPMSKEYHKTANRLMEKSRQNQMGLEHLIRQNNLGSKTAVMGIIKEIEGRMTDNDRDFYTLPYGFFTRLESKVGNATSEVLPASIRLEAMEMIKKAIKESRDAVRRQGKQYKQRARGLHPSIDTGSLDELFATDTSSRTIKLANDKGMVVDVPVEDYDRALKKGFNRPVMEK